MTQIVLLKAYWNDDKYTLQTYAALILSYLLIAAFWPKGRGAAAAGQRPGQGQGSASWTPRPAIRRHTHALTLQTVAREASVVVNRTGLSTAWLPNT